MRVPAGHPAGAVAGGLVPRSVRQDAKPGVSERPYLRSRQQIGTLNPGTTQNSQKKKPLAGNSTRICSPSGFVFWGLHYNTAYEGCTISRRFEQMTTVADGAPFFTAAGLNFTTPTESCREQPVALPRVEVHNQGNSNLLFTSGQL